MPHPEQQFENIPLGPIRPPHQQQQQPTATAAVYDGLAVGNGYPPVAAIPPPKRSNKCKIACYGTAVIAGIIAITLIIIIFVAGSKGSSNASATSSTSSVASSTTARSSSSAKASSASAKASSTSRPAALPTAAHSTSLNKRHFLMPTTPMATPTTRPASKSTAPAPAAARTTSAAALAKSTATTSQEITHETTSTESVPPAEQTLGILQFGAANRVPVSGVLLVLTGLGAIFWTL